MTLHTLRLSADLPCRPERYRRTAPAAPCRRIRLADPISAFLSPRCAIQAHFHRI
jgi:hypothetical protein